MINEQYMDLVTAYLQDSLSPEERADLNRLIDQGEIDILDLKEMEILYQKTGNLPAPEPSEDMQANFYDMLEEEKESQQVSLSNRMQRFFNTVRAKMEWRYVAVAMAIFLMGLLIGNLTTPFKNYNRQLDHLTNEVTQMRQVVALNLLDNDSPTERLKAVNISMDIRSDDHRVVQALLKTLNNDENVNVRLAAVEALIQRGNDAMVRQGLVRSINRQQSPLVQASLADAMLVLQETNSVKELKELLHKKNLDPSVHQKLQHTIAALS